MNLNVSALFFELALIFVPGFIWMKIHKTYASKGERSQFDLILNSFMFGVFSYAILFMIYRNQGISLKLFGLDTDSKRLVHPDVFPEILFAVIIAVFGGILTLYLENNKIFTALVQKIGATKTFGDEDVWDFMFNSNSSSVDYVHFRDFDNRVVYAGIVESFSESGALREIILSDVIVYDFEGTQMYEVPRLYLAKPRENIHIELPTRSK